MVEAQIKIQVKIIIKYNYNLGRIPFETFLEEEYLE